MGNDAGLRFSLMARPVMILVLVTTLHACTVLHNTSLTNYKVNEDITRNVGAQMVLRKVAVVTDLRYVDENDVRFAQELIYSGRTGDTITISYREYTRVVTGSFLGMSALPEGALMARPDFYQDLTYDLSSSDTIVFRDFRIKVLEANNEVIRFRVLAEPTT